MKSMTKLILLTVAVLSASNSSADFKVEETSIAAIQRAMADGEVNSVELVQQSLARIAAFDKTGPSVNAIITLNPRALDRARELDKLYARGEILGPLHGIPIIVKDNYDTKDMPTSAGSLSLVNSIPPDDAFQVRKLREAGALIIAKANMYEFAFSPYETVSSALPGHTLNPYALNRVPAGSSGGTAVAVAASFAVAGLGTDTGNSIRGPSSHNALVGIRSTIGLTSRDGIVPLYLDHDVGGPMARSVADAALLFEVITGFDPADTVTEAVRDQSPIRYTEFLDADGLRGTRIGVLRQLADREGADEDVLAKFAAAIVDLERAGATIIDNVTIAELDRMVPPVDGDSLTVWCARFKFDLENYLQSLGENAPFKTLQDIYDSGKFHPQLTPDLEYFLAQKPPDENEDCQAAVAGRAQLREAVSEVLDGNNLDALIYPTWSNPPRLIGDKNTPHGDNSQHVAPHTGFPAITVPMGYVHGTLPVGLQFVTRAYAEATMIKLAYAYEQATQHRRAPLSTPAL
jgi:amidase